MRALDRLALYSTCTATAVIIASTALIFHQLQPRWDNVPETRIREQPIVQAVDLSRLTPDIRQAIEQARSRGLGHARGELGSLRAEMMRKVDSNLLDWYFGYWTQQRLGLMYALISGKSWVAGLVADVDPEEASKNLQKEIAREFELRVMPGPILEQHLQRIAQQAVAVFVQSLQEHLQDIPKRYQIPPAQWDEYLERITFMIGGTEASRTVPLTFKALSAGVVLSGVGVTATLAPYVTAQFTQNMAGAAAGPSFRGAGRVRRSTGRNDIVQARCSPRICHGCGFLGWCTHGRCRSCGTRWLGSVGPQEHRCRKPPLAARQRRPFPADVRGRSGRAARDDRRHSPRSRKTDRSQHPDLMPKARRCGRTYRCRA